jgi:3-hydroxyacyl-CoA dehydrogenase/3-hydroxy-2-methylbutyryl-CoA dehydrogenase
MFQHVVALVSGGSSGLGAATASYLVRHGARVVVADLPRAYDSFMKLQDDIIAGRAGGSLGAGGGASIKFASTDVTKEDDVTMALTVAEDEFGEQGMI